MNVCVCVRARVHVCMCVCCLLNLDRLKVNDPMRQIARALFFTVGMRGWIDWIVKKFNDPVRQAARALFFIGGMREWIVWIVKSLIIISDFNKNINLTIQTIHSRIPLVKNRVRAAWRTGSLIF